MTQSQSSLSLSPQAVLGVDHTLRSIAPPVLRTTRSIQAVGSPLADADAIADMASGNLIRNLHLDDDDNGIQGRRLYMDGPSSAATIAIAVAPDVVVTDAPVDIITTIGSAYVANSEQFNDQCWRQYSHYCGRY